MTSASTPRPEEEWLSLREAAELLGMHPATVRLWADRNALPSRRTSGGHRRFRRSDIEAHLRQESERKPHPAARLLVQSVLGRVREAWAEGMLDRLPWHRHFDEAAREAYRRLGRRLLELLLRALTEAGAYPELLHEAARLGHEYGSITRTSQVPVADAVRAFLYFRSLVDETLIQLAEVQGTRDHQELPWAESLYQIQRLTNEILPALIEAALGEESSQLPSPPGSSDGSSAEQSSCQPS
ncbi:helix-turn-helix domain-containing protein [Thermogemmatispora sp.]|uniref:helix-turn-helix domain-containing protein n=1 Tax=Thermogemmatispora sp. TaxID=1968838 RepID=UPI001D1F9D0F|nr:helix-turn-helix domain-containing protein [Thermogemmatispora sp.]MBX5451650.1 helix-turn-helix domain-containing protein [Thermogemmatispora sp.]